MRRLWPVRTWRMWRLHRRLAAMDTGPLGLRFVGRSPVPDSGFPPPAPAEREEPPLMTMGQQMLFRVPEVRP